MSLFFQEMIKYNSSITAENRLDTAQIQLATNAVPTNEDNFKKFFTITSDTCPPGTKPYIIIRCYLTSKHLIRKIKFDTTQTTKFLDWLLKEKIYLKSDTLSIKKTAIVGYLTKLHPNLMNHTNLKPLLIDKLSDITIDPTLTTELDPVPQTTPT